MSEIRDRVIGKLVEIQTSEFSVDLRRRKGFTEAYIKRAKEILSIPEIAIVDRGAPPPAVSWTASPDSTASVEFQVSTAFRLAYRGYIKEIKDD